MRDRYFSFIYFYTQNFDIYIITRSSIYVVFKSIFDIYGINDKSIVVYPIIANILSMYDITKLDKNDIKVKELKKYIWIGKSKIWTDNVNESDRIIVYTMLYITFLNFLGFTYLIPKMVFNLISKKLKILLWNITIDITARYDIIIPILNTE